MTTVEAIDYSIHHNVIAFIPFSPEAYYKLRELCEGSVCEGNSGLWEFWGTRAGEEWCVHMRTRVQGGHPESEDYDTGDLVSVVDDRQVRVRWDDGMCTLPVDVERLSPWSEADEATNRRWYESRA